MQGFVLRNRSYAMRGEPVQAKPCGRALRGLDRTSGFAFLFHTCKTKPNQNRTFHLLFKPDILMCYEQAPAAFVASRTSSAQPRRSASAGRRYPMENNVRSSTALQKLR
jgi:hypothetical protein